MSTTKITSEILKIESPIRDVYALLSDFSRIGRLVEMAKQMGMTNGLEMDKISEKIESTRFTEDACYITLKGMGELAVKIVEKEEPKLIKLGGDGATPFMDSIVGEWTLRYPDEDYFSGRVEYGDENDAERKTGKRNQSIGRGAGKNPL